MPRIAKKGVFNVSPQPIDLMQTTEHYVYQNRLKVLFLDDRKEPKESNLAGQTFGHWNQYKQTLLQYPQIGGLVDGGTLMSGRNELNQRKHQRIRNYNPPKMRLVVLRTAQN